MRHIIIAYRPLAGLKPGEATPFKNHSNTPDIFEHVIEVSLDYRLHYISYSSEKGLRHTEEEFDTYSEKVLEYIVSLTGKIDKTEEWVLVLLHVGKKFLSFRGKPHGMIQKARIGTFMSMHGPVYKNIVFSNGYFIFHFSPRPSVDLLDEIWNYYDYDKKKISIYK